MEKNREELLSYLKDAHDIDSSVADEIRIYEEFEIYGDDAYKLLCFIVARFSVDFEKNGENLLRYFSSEPTLIFSFEFLWRYFKYGYFCTKPVTIGHLLKVIERKEWFDPD